MKRIQNRRTFIKLSGISVGILITHNSLAQPAKQYKAVVIGRTGGGDYGHGLDTIFNGLDNVTVTAVADENPEGLRKAKAKIGVENAYLDYREMIAKEKPDLVSIASRQPDCHRDMALAAIEAGAHIYMEKPITEIPSEGDEILQAANAKNIKIGVAHTKRYSNLFLRMKELMDEGYFGEVLEVRFTGKQDARVGAEDLIVLGSHDMDIMRLFFGDPLWCMASVLQDNRDAVKEDIFKGQEPYTLLGNTIRADYQFSNNVQCRWTSVKGSTEWNGVFQHKGRTIQKWGFMLFGTKRVLSYMEGIGTFVLDFPFIPSNDKELDWIPFESLGEPKKPDHFSHPIKNLIHAIETDTQPHCSGVDAWWAVEMVNAVYHSHKAKARVDFPVKNRNHPLIKW